MNGQEYDQAPPTADEPDPWFRATSPAEAIHLCATAFSPHRLTPLGSSSDFGFAQRATQTGPITIGDVRLDSSIDFDPALPICGDAARSWVQLLATVHRIDCPRSLLRNSLVSARTLQEGFQRDLGISPMAVGARAAVVFPEYSLSPEARYPVAIEHNYTVARWIVTDGAGKGLDAARPAVAGDSVGGNMTAALTLMAKERGDVPLVQQVLFYPVTDASFDTDSYHRFATGYFLRRDGVQYAVVLGPVHHRPETAC